MRKAIIKIAIFLTAILPFNFGLAPVAQAADTAVHPGRGMWTWTHPATVAPVVDWAVAHNVNEIYLSEGWATPTGAEYTYASDLKTAAHAHGITVAALGGDPSWSDPSDPGHAANWAGRMAGTGLFDAIHFDIEPWADGTLWAPANQAATVAYYKVALADSKTAIGAMPLEEDVPFWWGTISNGSGGDMMHDTVALTDSITVLSYRNTAANVLALLTDAKAASDAAGKGFRVGLEVANSGTPGEDFSALGTTRLEDAITTIESTLTPDVRFSGVSVEFYAPWSTLGSTFTNNNYHPITQRSATLSSSKTTDPSATISWNAGTTATVRGIKVLMCTTGNESSACVAPTGASMSSSTLGSTGGGLGSGWTYTVTTSHEVTLTKAGGSALTAGQAESVVLNGLVNPTYFGTYFFRVYTYSTTAAAPADAIDFGSMGTSTARTLTETGDVAETLTFRVANSVATDCLSQTDIADPNDAASDLVTLSPNPMTIAGASRGTAQMCIYSNAGSGYAITYHDAAVGGATKGFYNGSHEFAVANGFTSTPGTEQFGFNLRANTGFTGSADPDGTGLVADLTNANYGTANSFSYDDTGAAITLATKTGPNASARYTMSYIANVSVLTPGGTYKSHQIFVATATF